MEERKINSYLFNEIKDGMTVYSPYINKSINIV